MGNKRRWINSKYDVRCWVLMNVFVRIIVLAQVNVVWLRGKTPSIELVLDIEGPRGFHMGKAEKVDQNHQTLGMHSFTNHVCCVLLLKRHLHMHPLLGEEQHLTPQSRLLIGERNLVQGEGASPLKHSLHSSIPSCHLTLGMCPINLDNVSFFNPSKLYC